MVAVGVRAGDVVSLQASIGRLGPPARPATLAELSTLVVDAFLDVLGDSGTLILPTFTYSIGRRQPFDVERTPSDIGEFTEVFRTRPGVMRSRDPMLSHAGLGPAAPAILRSISQSCCGEGSVFHNLRRHGATICTLGVAIYYATFIQHIEEMAAVPFRRHKPFTGQVVENGVASDETWTYYAAPFLANCEADPLALQKLARDAGIVRVAEVGRGQLMAVDAEAYFNFGLEVLRRDPWLTAKGPPCDAETIAANMNRKS